MRKGRRVAIVAACGTAGVVALAAVYWFDFAVTFHSCRLASDPELMLELYQADVRSPRRVAAELYWAGLDDDARRALVASWRTLGDYVIGPPLESVISAVDAEEKLVVISAGDDQSVQKGDVFRVFRGEVEMGEIEVIRVYADLAGARIRTQRAGESIQRGDIVTSWP